MNSLFAILFGFPSVLVIALLAIIGVVSTVSNICEAFKIGDYEYLYWTMSVTIVAAIVGWNLGNFL